MKNYPVLSKFGSRRLQILEDLRATGGTPPDAISCRRRRWCFWWRKSRWSWEAWLLFVRPVRSWVSTRGTSRCPPWAASRRWAARVCKAKTAVRCRAGDGNKLGFYTDRGRRRTSHAVIMQGVVHLGELLLTKWLFYCMDTKPEIMTRLKYVY